MVPTQFLWIDIEATPMDSVELTNGQIVLAEPDGQHRQIRLRDLRAVIIDAPTAALSRPHPFDSTLQVHGVDLHRINARGELLEVAQEPNSSPAHSFTMEDAESASISAECLRSTLNEHIRLIDRWLRSPHDIPPASRSEIGTFCDLLRSLWMDLDASDSDLTHLSRSTVLDIEHTASVIYAAAMRVMVDCAANESGVDRAPDLSVPMSAMLQYGTGLLRARVWAAIRRAGLAPQRALASDLTARLRPVFVDWPLLQQLARRPCLQPLHAGQTLRSSTRRLVATTVFGTLRAPTPIGPAEQAIVDEVQRLAATLRAGCEWASRPLTFIPPGFERDPNRVSHLSRGERYVLCHQLRHLE